MDKIKGIETAFRTYYSGLHRLAAMMLHDPQRADDVVQDLFTSLLQSEMKEVSPAYLVTAVRNLCLKRIRHMEVRERVALLLSLDDREIADPPEMDPAREISSLISTLSPRCREVMEMRFRDGLKNIEIARKLDISEAAVYKHLKNGIEFLRSKLEADGKD